MIKRYESSWEYDCGSTPEAWTHNCYMLVNFAEGLKLKINELVDVINALVEENNIHEKQIDELQMKLEPEKCETRTENVQPDTKSRQENVQKETFVSIDEALNTATAKELARTRKALDVAVDALKEIQDKGEYVNPIELAESYLDEITSLEQKE